MCLCVSYLGSVQDLRHCTSSLLSNRRASVCSPESLPLRNMERKHKLTSYHESITHLDFASLQIRSRTQTDNSLHNTPSKPLNPHRDLVSTKSLPLSIHITPSPIVVNVRKPSKSSDSSDKTPSQLLSPSPDSSDKFKKRFISSPPPSKRRTTHIELTCSPPSPFLLSPSMSPAPPKDRARANSPDDSSNDDVFGSPDHSSSSLVSFSIQAPKPDTLVSTDSQGSEEGSGRSTRPSKSPVRKPSLLRRTRGLPNAERKKRTVTFTPEVRITAY